MKRMLNQNLIDFLNSLGDSLKYESSTNTFEIGTNLSVNGNIETNGLSIWELAQNEQAFLEYQYDVDNFRLINYNTTAITNIPLIDNSEITLITNTDITEYLNMNLKTLFGNKSIVKDPHHPEDTNIDLYKHFISISGTNEDYYIEIISSNNLNVDSLTDLTTLTKAVNGTIILSCWSSSLGSPVYLIYNNGVWKDDGNRTIDGTVVDKITTI